MNEVLTMAEIKERFPSEWILLADPETDKALEVLSGRVILHHPDRDEFDRQAVNIRGGRLAVVYTGKPPEGMEFLL